MAGDAPAPLFRTPLHDWHSAHGGRMVEFGGWSMPVQYSTINEEHQAVRKAVGLFDIGHMGRLTFDGPAAQAWLERVTTNHVGLLKPGQIQYSLLANEYGGVVDDVLVYRMADGSLRMVCNASNREKVIGQLRAYGRGLEAMVHDHTGTTAMIALQGPEAEATLGAICDLGLADLKYYHVAEGRITTGPMAGVAAVVSRTGYTGEAGFEVILPAPAALPVWEGLLEAGRDRGIKPCGLGARDTLRFEAGMPLYGHEMDESVNPYAAGLGWAVKLGKGEFVGRSALLTLKDHPGRTRVGLALEGKRIARQGAPVLKDGQNIGVVTSGTFSPTLGRSLAMALVDPPASAVGTRLSVDVRGNMEAAEVVAPPFYRRAKT